MAVDQERTAAALSTKTYKRWGSLGKRWPLLTDTNSVVVSPTQCRMNHGQN